VDVTWLAKTPPLEAIKRTVAILKESKALFALASGFDEFGTAEVPDNFICIIKLQNDEVSLDSSSVRISHAMILSLNNRYSFLT